MSATGSIQALFPPRDNPEKGLSLLGGVGRHAESGAWKGSGNHLAKSVNPKRLLIQTRDQRQLSPARFEEGLFAPHPDLFNRFQAVGDESRAHDKELFDAFFRQADQLKIGVRFQPGVSAQARLKGR